MTDKQKHEPGVCPCCGNEGNIDYGTITTLAGGLDLCCFEAVCNECGATWEEHYTLVFDSHEQIEKPDER
jgi:hypothetical protein